MQSDKLPSARPAKPLSTYAVVAIFVELSPEDWVVVVGLPVSEASVTLPEPSLVKSPPSDDMEFSPAILLEPSIVTPESCITVPDVPFHLAIAVSVEDTGPVTLAIVVSCFAAIN
jgi:hypothetical protein